MDEFVFMLPSNDLVPMWETQIAFQCNSFLVKCEKTKSRANDHGEEEFFEKLTFDCTGEGINKALRMGIMHSYASLPVAPTGQTENAQPWDEVRRNHKQW